MLFVDLVNNMLLNVCFSCNIFYTLAIGVASYVTVLEKNMVFLIIQKKSQYNSLKFDFFTIIKTLDTK